MGFNWLKVMTLNISPLVSEVEKKNIYIKKHL